MTGVWVEPECTITLAGNAFTSGGVTVTDDRIVVYVGRQVGGPTGVGGSPYLPLTRPVVGKDRRAGGWWWLGQYDATDWHGNVIGLLTETARWRVPGGWVSGWMHSYRLELPDGRTYNVRGSGEGMSATGRRAHKHGRPV